MRLAGFKSFANPTILEFEAGVNVIVGPNGSGKSNIADALAWVLGSQAPSSLRGASMEDVIFAGAKGRERLGMAEVALTLDNSSGVLGLQLSEVEISRVTDRTGTSDYKINGTPCRLLDIQELLSDTGIGRSLHTVVGQGQLDAVLHARPEDRRTLIEEAAQIGKFRRRKDRARRKIERVDENLLRLNDVMTELRRAIKPLKRQATAASAHSELLAEHADLRRRLAATEVHRLWHQKERLDTAEAATRVDLLSDELSSLRARLTRAAQEREKVAEEAEKARDTAAGITRAADRLAGLERLAAERGAALSARLSAETEEGYRERIRLLNLDRSRFSAEAERLGSEAGEATGAAESARRGAEQAAAARDETDRALSEARSRETAAAQALVRAEGTEAAGRATLEAIRARVDSAAERRVIAERELAADAGRVTGAEGEVLGVEAELDRVTEAAAASETVLEEAREEADRRRERLARLGSGLAAARARLGALREVGDLFSDRPDVIDLLQPLIEESRTRAEAAGGHEREGRSRLVEAEAEAERLWLDVAAHDEELRRLDALMEAAAERLAGSRRRHEARQVELAALDDELARARDALAETERKAAEERAALPAHQAALQEAKRTMADAESSFDEARAAFARADRIAIDLELTARAIQERFLAAELRAEEAEAGIADAERALSGLADLRARLAGARDRARAISSSASEGARTARTWSIEAADRMSQQARRSRAAAVRLESMRGRERELAEQIEVLARRRNEDEIRKAEAQARMEALGERAMDEWGMSVEALLGIEGFGDEAAENDARTRVDALDREMKRLGPVNPRAHEEYAELAEREEFLTEQMEDLRSSKGDLMKVVAEVDETIVEVFTTAFEDVAREFEAVFDRMFPGGEGRLGLTDPSDILGSGVEIEARPPGKNVKKLSLLSGGERSLVALGFLFSIFRARPSPFYLLDEVEAALDDINLQRFLGLVGELEERAQILIVTHQKRTMEAADVLYGVSMARDGVSTVVAKRLDELERAPA